MFDEADIICQALPRPLWYMQERFCAAAALPASAAHLYLGPGGYSSPRLRVPFTAARAKAYERILLATSWVSIHRTRRGFKARWMT
jgi:hypothetical protein